MPHLKIPKPDRSFETKLPASNDKNLKLEKNQTKNFPTIFACFLIAFIALLVSYHFIKGPKIYAEASGHKIYLSEINHVIGSSKNIPANKAAVMLADKYFTEALAREKQISLSNTDVNKAWSEEYHSKPKVGSYAWQDFKNGLMYRKLAASVNGEYKGKFLIASFNRYVAVQSPFLEEKKKQNPAIGNEQLIAEDKRYASDFMSNIYFQLQSKQITFDQAIVMERNDPRIGEQAYQSSLHSGTFDNTKNLPVNDVVLNESALSQITKFKPGEISKPFIVKVSDSAYPTSKQSTAEAYFLIVQLDKSKPGVPGSFDTYISKAKNRLGYKINE